MDFFRVVCERKGRPGRSGSDDTGEMTIKPNFLRKHTEDLMIRGGAFYAFWDERRGTWSKDIDDCVEAIDQEMYEWGRANAPTAKVASLQSFRTRSFLEFKRFCDNSPDNAVPMDQSLVWLDDKPPREAYSTHRLPYTKQPGEAEAWNELMHVLYAPKELEKIEWCIGAVVTGDAKDIQKFLVLYGSQGSGKSTVLNIVKALFEGYTDKFSSEALTSGRDSFGTAPFITEKLVMFDHDGDLGHIRTNTTLNSIVAHEPIRVNPKYGRAYDVTPRAMLMVASNSPVRITDARSGMLRRLIDATPTENTVSRAEYNRLLEDILANLGQLATHCEAVYRRLGKGYYDSYRPARMWEDTDTFHSFMLDNRVILKGGKDDGITLLDAWTLYKNWADDALLKYPMTKREFKHQLRQYYAAFYEQKKVGNVRKANWFSGLKTDMLEVVSDTEPEPAPMLELKETESLLDEMLADCPAQYANEHDTPMEPWDRVVTKLSDLDTSRVHFVRVPENHIVIDFDLKGIDNAKSIDANLQAAAEWPETYAELSKGGAGVHLHYIFDGDPSSLSPVYSPGIEVKVYSGKQALRRRVSTCNATPVAHISSGLPVRSKKVLNTATTLENEQHLRALVKKALEKKVHPDTKSNVDFIKKILDDAYSSGMPYDLDDMRQKVSVFASASSNQAITCMKTVSKMHFHSEMSTEEAASDVKTEGKKTPTFFDIEVFPNLFVMCWKDQGSSNVVKMINPDANAIAELLRTKNLVGFNNRRYDNHILYGAYMGYSVSDLYSLSQRIINGDVRTNAMFSEAYSLSYADIYDFSSTKKSLKKWEIELGIKHVENEYPWDEPLDESHWQEVADYCANDVEATEALWNHLSYDWDARLMLADIAGLTPNHTTNQLTQQIIFGNNKKPPFEHRDLSLDFPGYEFEAGKSTYRGEEVGEGGYVYAEPGAYRNVALLDIASMHPHSAIALNCWGDYTDRFKQLVEARIDIKHGDLEKAKSVLDGKLRPYLDGDLKNLAYSLKIAINSVYGLSSAKFPTRCNGMNPQNNVDNIIAKRGALFMIDLKHAVQEKGFTVAHIKTDSIKIPDATPEIIQFVVDYGKKWGYTFEHEATYDRMCLTNNAVYIAHDNDGWHATGAMFQQPYVWKTLFTHEPLVFNDYCVTKSVSTKMYLDMNEGNENEHTRVFVGRVNSFVPIAPGHGGGTLLREKDGKFDSVAGTKGFRFLVAEEIKGDFSEDMVDLEYFRSAAAVAIGELQRFGVDSDWLA